MNMQIRSPHEKQWRTIHRTNNEIEQLVKQIAIIVRELGKKKKYMEFASEYHLAAHFYHSFTDKLPLGWEIMIAPTMSTRKPRYKESAKNIPTFFIPDIVIFRKKTKVEEKKHPKSKSAKVRFDCDRKNSIAIELSLQRPEKTNEEVKMIGIDLNKIDNDRKKYKRERFKFHCIYVNQHPNTILTPERFDQFSKLCNEKWFHYTGEDISDKTDRLIYIDKNGKLINQF
jgi:hypothetical protein